jgi:hypothetical protein
MLSKWLRVMVSYAEPVVVSHGVLCWAIGCESCCVILSLLRFSYGVPCRAIRYEWYEPMIVNYDVLWWTSGCESWCVMLSQWLWIHVCYTEPNSCESCCVILSRLCFSYGVSCRAIGYEWYEPMVVNYDVLWWTSDCESWCVMLSKWLRVMVSYAKPVVVSHGA